MTYLDASGPSAPLQPHALLYHQTGANQGTFGVSNDGVNLLILVERLKDVVKSLSPHPLMPLSTGRSTLELPHGVLGVHAAGHMAKTAESLEGVTLRCVEEAVKGARPEVILPTLRRLNLVRTLRIRKGGKVSGLKSLSKRTKLDFEVLCEPRCQSLPLTVDDSRDG